MTVQRFLFFGTEVISETRDMCLLWDPLHAEISKIRKS